MPNSHRPLRLNVGFLVNQDIGYSHEIPLDFEKIRVADDLELRDFKGTLHISRTPQGLFFAGEFSSHLDVECARCLCTFDATVYWELTELFAFNEKFVTESDLLLPEDAQVDLAPIVRDYALTEVPINPVHSADCKGLCIECGQDLNVVDCGHSQDDNNSPFAALKDLLERRRGKN